MAREWLNLFFRFSGFTHKLKQRVIEEDSVFKTLPYALLLIVIEFGFAVVSIPMYLVVAPGRLQETGFVFPNQEKGEPQIQKYTIRRKISVATFFSATGVFLAKILFISGVSFFLLGGQALLAATETWDFSIPGDYSYDSGVIEFTGGVAQLKDLGGTSSGSTTNSGFDSDSTGWTFVGNWSQAGGTSNSGAWESSGGNPGGYVRTSLAAKKGVTQSAYWYQGFTTSVDAPTTSTLNLDWIVNDIDPACLTSFHLYAFIGTDSGKPTVGSGNQVWDSGNLIATSSWSGTGAIDIAANLPTAGTYYIKIGSVAVYNATATPINIVSGFDNAVVNWAKTTTSYDAGEPTIQPVSSLVPPVLLNWYGFTETATKNGGEIYYQLSDDDGTTWKYWNGSAWILAGGAQYNTASDINTNISSFPIANKKIMWKAFLSSDGTQQVILDSIDIGYTDNNPPSVSSISAEQRHEALGLVDLSYVLTDEESDVSSLSSYQYSLTGDFAGEEATMTEAATDSLHDGIADLSTSPSGTTHHFVWDAGADLSAVNNETVYVRLQANDGANDSLFASSSVFAVDLAAPVISNVSASQTVSTTDVVVSYDLNDDTQDNLLVEMDISQDGGTTWDVATSSLSGDVGSGQTTSTAKSITWSAGTDFFGQEQNDIRVRLRAKDYYYNQSDNVESADFSLDTAGPAGLDSFTKSSGTSSQVTLNWSSGVVDNNFNHYEIWYGSNLDDVNNRTGSANLWDYNDDSALLNSTTTATVVTGLSITSNYYMKIWAIDDFGNESTLDAINVYEAPQEPTPPPSSGGGGGGAPPPEFVSPDTTAPEKPILNTINSPVQDISVTISGSAEPRSIISLYDGGEFVTDLQSLTGTDGVFSQTFTFSEGQHNLTARAKDSSGNISAPSDVVSFLIYLTPPVVEEVVPTESTTTETLPTETVTTPEVTPPQTGLPEVIPTPTLTPTPTPVTPTPTPTTPVVETPPVVEEVTPQVIEAVETPSLPAPEITSVETQVSGDSFSFSGKALPNSTVVVYINSEKTLVYSTKSDSDGNWTIEHSQDNITLKPGEHTIFAVSVDENTKVKTPISSVAKFEIRRNPLVMLYNLLNLQTTVITMVILLLAMWYLYRIRLKQPAENI